MAFYDFSAEHWSLLRTTNPIESTLTTVRHRHRHTKDIGSPNATLFMVSSADRRIRGYQLHDKEIQVVIFTHGIEQEKVAKEEAA